MFRIESYITSIILSYVDRYIKNFRQQDAQVSLWEGDGSFQNLNLDLDVLEQELNLPFNFISGHIHELLIHVPWTRLVSEPVKITINTIECVMKLKPVGSHHPHARAARRGPRAVEDPQNQSTLMSSLVNKIICNLSVTCNNLILKYVEEDIVLSMNIKTLSIGTVNSNWEPSFIELSAANLELRKLISLSDVTICLDKRNASGRIESYLEPLLYRCFLTARLWQCYPSVMAKRPQSTRIDILCEQMAFTVSEPQLPMLMRLMTLCLALHRKQLSQTSLVPTTDDSSTDKSDEDVMDGQDGEQAESWSSWAFSWMPTLIPLTDENTLDYDPYLDSFPANNIFNFGFYVDTFTLALKLCESDGSGGVKTQSQAFMHVLFKGCRMDLLSHNTDWTNVQMGISQATVKPDGDCCCGVSEASQLVYLSSGSMHEEFMSGSLFHKSPSQLEDRLGHTWKYHLESVSETIMLEKTPAFAIDYLSCVQDRNDDEESDDEDGESLPPKEKVVIRYVAGPVVIKICSGLIHRIQMLMKACSTYDYVPYTTNTVLPVVQDHQVMDLVHRLSERSIEMNEDLYSRYLPLHTAQFTAFNTTLELYPANHVPVHFSSLGRKLSRTQRKVVNSGSNLSSPSPCVTVEWKCVYAKLTRPLYPDKILLMASKFTKDKLPIEISNTSLTRLAFKAVGVLSSVRLPFLQAMKVVEMSSVTSEQTWHSLITPLEDAVSSDVGVHIANVTITSSKAKLLLLYETISSLIATNNRQQYLASYKTIFNTSLLNDAATTTDTIYLKLSLEQVNVRRVLTGLSSSTFLSMMAGHLFAVRLTDKSVEWETMIVSAPDTTTPTSTPLLEVLYQQPFFLNVFPPLLVFKLQEVRFSADPLLFSWLLYTPTPSFPAHPPALKSHKSTESIKSRKVSESSLSSYMRRVPTPTPQESIHSSSERETIPSGHPSSQPLGECVQPVPTLPFPDRVASLYPVWKAMLVHGDINQLTVYLPATSLAQPRPHSMEEGLTLALRQSGAPALQVCVVTLPAVAIRSANHKSAPEFNSPLPVKLPSHLWNADKDNFPWLVTVSDLHCYTLKGAVRLPLLKPVSFNCTIGTSPKFTDRKILTSLALCVHLDTTPVNIKVSEEQVVLIVNLLMAQLRVLNVLMPVWSVEPSTVSDTSSVKLIGSDESSITQSDELSRGGGPVKVKLTGWLQWTLARTTVSIYNKLSGASRDELKLTLDVEDVILSLDVERVYHKVKLKVATASVCHYVRSSCNESWKRGAFHGLVMRGYDPDGFAMKHSSDEGQAPAGFIMATVTRAKCNNFHSRLGSPSKHPGLTKKSVKNDKFITEVEVKMQPLDFVLSPTTLGMFVRVLDPLLSLSQPSPASEQKPPSSYHSSSLPLLYLDLMTIRVVLPTLRQKLTEHQPDVLIIQFDVMTANPHPENPICRTPLRPDIYHRGEKLQILNIPGSDLEDRQYQFNLSNLRVQTGMWQDLEGIFVREVAVSSQQNPALDWNEGRSPMFQVPASQLMHPLINSFNLNVVIAPAMMYQDKHVVCGHACEINALSDIGVMVTLDQLFLCGLLSSEMQSALYSAPQRQRAANGDGAVPSSHNTGLQHLLTDHDSGIESLGSSSSLAKQVDPNIPGVHAVSSSGFSQVSGLVHSSVPSTIYPTSLVWPSKRSVIPCEVLVTCSAVTLAVFGVEYSEQPAYEPLIHAHLSQPHVFLCKNSDSQLSCQVSAFDLNVSCGVKGHTVAKQAVSKPFPQPLLETRNGEPHAVTGIPPALFTAKMIWSNDKPPKIDVDLGRPVRFTIKLDVIDYLKELQKLIYSSFVVPSNMYTGLPAQKVTEVLAQKRDVSQVRLADHSLRRLLGRFSLVTLKTRQLLLNVHSSFPDEVELLLSVAKFSTEITSNLSLQQAVTGLVSLDGITVSTHKVKSAKQRLVIDPWQLTVKSALSWDSWLTTTDPPLVNVSIHSDILSIQLSPEQLNSLAAVCKDYAPLCRSSAPTAEKNVPSRENSGVVSSTEEQQYYDDLQAGAFQFVEAGGRREDLPLTYQVVFWSGQSNTPTMAWRYPQPRAITKFCVLPIPFREVGAGGEMAPTCVLQYYSESQAGYQDLVSFGLSESATQPVELPRSQPRVVAAVWRVVMGHDAALITPVKALAASIRVDSYFSPTLVPTLQLAVNLAAVELCLWTHTDSYLPLPNPLDRYYLDRRFPEEHDFCKIVLEQANIAFLVWPRVSQQVMVKGRARLDILDYCTLSYQCCVPPFPLVAASHWTAECRQCSLVAGHVTTRIGPTVSHSLHNSLSSWSRWLSGGDQPSYQPVLTPYVVCNNTYLPIRFRQAGSDEYIPLQCFQCHLYSWRTTKHPMELEFGLLEPEDNEWSKAVSLKPNSNSVIRLHTAAREFALLISVQRFSPTVCQVIINGQLALHNNLSVPMEVRVVPECGEQCSLVVQCGTSPPTVIIDPRYSLSLKVRFCSASPAQSLWSGEIPLRHDDKVSSAHMQWEVKLPLKEKGQFQSVWCHVVWNTVGNVSQMLVVLSPLYMIKSLLPCQTNVLIETPALSSSQAISVAGRGMVTQLDTPGLSEETHNLTFQLEGKVPASSPPVSLHYRLMDGTPCPDPGEMDINTLLSRLQQTSQSQGDWPYLGRDWAAIDWVVTTQPDTITHVKVRYADNCLATNMLLVEVQPWALLVNTLGTHIYLQGQERTLCSLANRAVISPPPLESTFQIGVELEGSVQLSQPIQLKKGPGFEMPFIPGLLPPTGFINTSITHKDTICYINITSSEEVKNLRLIHVRSTYVIANLSRRDLTIATVAVEPSTTKCSLPEDVMRSSVVIQSQAKPGKPKVQPLTEWRALSPADNLLPHLVVSTGGALSCPVQVPATSERTTVNVLFPAAPQDSSQEMLVMTTEQRDGQVIILLWDQPYPQITIHNHTNSVLHFGKAKAEANNQEIESDCEHIEWMLRMEAGTVAHYSFPAATTGPDNALPNILPAARIGVATKNPNGIKWSDPINLTNCSGRLLTLLGLPDLSMSVSRRGFTTHVTLTQASHTEILAVDIRGQLTRQLMAERQNIQADRNAVEDKQIQPIIEESPPQPNFSPADNGSGGGGDMKGLDVSCYVHGLTVTLLTQTELVTESREVAALTLDQLALTLDPHPHQDTCVRELKVHATVSDMQLDNQEFSAGGYDFPVVMLMQKSPAGRSTEVTMSQHARRLVEEVRGKGSAADITVVIDTNSHSTMAVQDINVKLLPLQIYIEDKYVYHMKDCLMKTIPSSLFNESPSTSKSSNQNTSVSPESNIEPKTKQKDVHKPVEKELLERDLLEDLSTKKNLSEGAEEEDLFNVSEPDVDGLVPEETAAPNTDLTVLRQTIPTYEAESMWSINTATACQQTQLESSQTAEGFPIAADVVSASRDLARPLRLRSLNISELNLLVSIHTSTRFYIALDHSPLQLAAFKRSSLFTTAYRLGHSLTLHYFFGAIYGTGWALGSLELLGAPGGLARSLGLGLRDFINLPLQGILVGPRAFFTGIAHGSASLMQHFAAGTITSVTRLAASWARTLDRLTLDCQDLERSEQLRRLRPQNLTQGVVQGLTEFGISLIGAISSIAHHPLQYVMSHEPDRSLVNSIGRGLVGVVTRPLSGVAELVALTGEGLLTGVGWTDSPVARQEPTPSYTQSGTDSRLKYKWKLLMPGEQLLLIADATTDCYEAVTLLVTDRSLYVVNAELDIVVRAIKLDELQTAGHSRDPTLVVFRIMPAKEQAHLLSQSRIIEYVRESQRVLAGELSNISPPPTPSPAVEVDDSPQLEFYINPQVRNHFLSVLSFATSHSVGRGFPVIR